MAEDSPFEPDTSQDVNHDGSLPSWQRFLFAMVLPNVLLYGGLLLYILYMILLQSKARHGHSGTPDDGWRGMADVYLLTIAIPVVTLAVLALGVLPITICTIRAARIRWKHWWSAIFGGLLAMLCGLLFGAIGLFLLVQLMQSL